MALRYLRTHKKLTEIGGKNSAFGQNVVKTQQKRCRLNARNKAL